MKTTERLAGSVTLKGIADEEPQQELIYSADPLGVWLEDNLFMPWSAIEWVKPDNG